MLKSVRAWGIQVAVALAWSFQAWAQVPPPAAAFTLDLPSSILRGYRFANPGKPPILLVHGLSQNADAWTETAERLRSEGYDVWTINLRGHGRGVMRSVAKGNVTGAYGFDRMLADDIPAVIEHVFSSTQKKLTVMGHSMGSMLLGNYLDGVRTGPRGKLFEDPERKAWIARNRIEDFYAIGGPPHFRSLEKRFHALAHFFKPMSAVDARFRLPAPGLPSRAGSSLAQVAGQMMPLGVMNPRNLDARELSRLMREGFSSVHSDLIYDFRRWVREGKWTSRDGFNYERPRERLVDTLYMAGDQDRLAHAKDIAEQAATTRRGLRDGKRASIAYALAENTSHADLISGSRAAEILSTAMREFKEDSGALSRGSTARVYSLPSPCQEGSVLKSALTLLGGKLRSARQSLLPAHSR